MDWPGFCRMENLVEYFQESDVFHDCYVNMVGPQIQEESNRKRLYILCNQIDEESLTSSLLMK